MCLGEDDVILTDVYMVESGSYLDENNNFVYLEKENKVYIRTINLGDFISKNLNINDKNIILKAKELYDYFYKYASLHTKQNIEELTKKAQRGWTWFQNKESIKEKLEIYDENNIKILRWF